LDECRSLVRRKRRPLVPDRKHQPVFPLDWIERVGVIGLNLGKESG
jgi:hypothetical protein